MCWRNTVKSAARICCALLFCAAPSWLVAEPAQVRVGGYHFPPYVVRPEQGGDDGLVAPLLTALNRTQDAYFFTLVPTSATRRYRDFEQARFDVILFESPTWGWQEIAFEGVDMFLEDEELFVAARAPGRGQEYFEDLRGKRLALYQGYHYAFADFNSDQDYLASNYNALLTYSHDSNLQMITRDRADIALVTRSFLTGFSALNPQHAKQLLVSRRVDQIYRHHALVRPGATISAAQLHQLLQQLRASGELARIFEPYAVRLIPVSAGNSATADAAD